MDPLPVASVEEARRLRRGIVLVVVAANFGAALLLFCLLNFLINNPDDDLASSFAQFVVVSVIAFGAGSIIGSWLFRPLERWVEEGRPPTPAEQALAIGGPRLVALLAFGFWVATAVIIGTIEVLDGGPAIEGLRNGGAVFAGGLTATALSYLLVERRARPLVAAVLAGRAPARSRTLGLRPRLLLSWALGSGVPFFAILVGELSAGPDDPRISSATAVFLVCVGLVIGALMTVTVVRSVAEPIDGVRAALAAVQKGDLAVAVPVDDGGEIGRLQAGVNQMVEGLRERQHLADLFGRHVGGDVARQALEQGIRLGGERREAAALFVDLRNSTGLAASTAPEEVVEVLNRFFAVVVETVTAEGGWVNKFEGDGALCVFGAPVSQPDHAARALRAARTLRDRLADAGLSGAIGVSAGEVVAGNVGTEARYEYTVIGDPVNEAARLTEAAKDHDGATLASGAAVDVAGDEAARWEPVAEVHLRGRSAVTRAFAPGRGRPAAPAPASG